MSEPVGRPRADRALLLVGGLTAAVLWLLTPPFQVPDEPAHFFRAFAISEGRFVAVRDGAKAGVMIPESLLATKTAWEQGVPFHPEVRVDLAQAWPTFRMPLDPEQRRFRDISNVAVHTPIPYLPQALGIAVGRALGAPPIVLLHLGRLANAVVSLLLCWLAIRLVPFGAWPMLLATLLPIFCFLRSSLSADALTYSFAFVSLSAGLGVALGEAPPDAKLRRTYAASTVLLLLSKYAYFWIPLVILLGLRRRDRARPLLRLTVACYAAGLVLLGAWYAAIQDVLAPMAAGSDPAARLGTALSHPLQHAALLAGHLSRVWTGYAQGLVGSLGWLDTRLPDWFTSLYWLALGGVSVGSAAPRLGGRGRLALAGLGVLGYLAVVNAVFLLMPLRAQEIRGVQARYLLPVLACFVMAGVGIRPVPALARLAPALCCGLGMLSLLVTGATLARRYYGWP